MKTATGMGYARATVDFCKPTVQVFDLLPLVLLWKMIGMIIAL